MRPQDSAQELNIQLKVHQWASVSPWKTFITQWSWDWTLMSQWFCAINMITQLVVAWSSNNKLYFLFTIVHISWIVTYVWLLSVGLLCFRIALWQANQKFYTSFFPLFHRLQICLAFCCPSFINDALCFISTRWFIAWLTLLSHVKWPAQEFT